MLRIILIIAVALIIIVPLLLVLGLKIQPRRINPFTSGRDLG